MQSKKFWLQIIFSFSLITSLYAKGGGAPVGPEAVHHKMTGDWSGGRKLLREHGITFPCSYTVDAVGNPVGGQSHGFAYAGSFGLAVHIDFDKACGVTGLELWSDLVWRTGTSLSRKKIGNQFPVQQVYGSQTIKLNELYLKETLFGETLVLKAGRLDAGNDFLQNPLYYYYVNNAFDGNPISVFFNTQFMAYPNSTWGAYLAIQPTSWLLAQFAVYNANGDISLNKYHGCEFTFESTNGVIWITQWDLINDSSYPGNYKFGYFYQNGLPVWSFIDANTKGDSCFYILLDQMVYRPQCVKKGESRGIIPWITLVFQPKNINFIPFFTTSGIVYKGPFASRPRDALVVGFAYGRFSKAMEKLQREAKLMLPMSTDLFGTKPQTYEAVAEMNYWIQVTDWCTIVPDIQYIIRPDGTGKIPNALVLGAQIGLVL